MKTSLTQFELIGSQYAGKLKNQMKIVTVDDFLKHDLTEIHEKTQIDMDRLSQWIEIMDLYRIPNLTPREAELLHFANINSVQELSHRQAIRIFYKLREIDEKSYYIILQLPTFAKINKWIYYAKLMVKRIKYGENIPIILLPMVNFDQATAFKKFNIFTIEDLMQKKPLIKNLRKKVHLSRKEYKELFNLINLIQIGGIDIILAQMLSNAGIKSGKDLLELNYEEILQKIKEQDDFQDYPIEIIRKDEILEIQNNFKKLEDK